MYCTSCGEKLKDDDKFCPNCGDKFKTTVSLGDVTEKIKEYANKDSIKEVLKDHTSKDVINKLNPNLFKYKIKPKYIIGIIFALLLIVIISVTSIKSGVNSSPKNVVKNYMEGVASVSHDMVLKSEYTDKQIESMKNGETISDIISSSSNIQQLHSYLDKTYGQNFESLLKYKEDQSQFDSFQGIEITPVEIILENKTIGLAKVKKSDNKYYLTSGANIDWY